MYYKEYYKCEGIKISINCAIFAAEVDDFKHLFSFHCHSKRQQSYYIYVCNIFCHIDKSVGDI